MRSSVALNALDMKLIKLALHSGDNDARIHVHVIGTRLDHGVRACEIGELTRADWRLRFLKRILNENIVLMMLET